MGKRLRVTIILYLKTVFTHADTRFIIQSRKSSNANPEDPTYRKNEAEPKGQKQAQLRKTRGSAEETWAKLAIETNAKPLLSLRYGICIVTISLFIGYLKL